MASYIACEGSGKNAVALSRNQPVSGMGWDTVPARTYGKCSACDHAVGVRGHVSAIKVARHKPKDPE